MRTVRNILFIMADQLRWDYLSCYGHPHLHTPHIDTIARRGVRFDRAYAQSPVCGPSRASFYTGRTVFSHGATWNRVPLPVGERTLGDYLAPAGVLTAVVGKTHMKPDTAGMERLGVAPDSAIGGRVAQTGFDPFERDDGLHPDQRVRAGASPAYNRWLNALGYEGDNPWHDYANSAQGPGGEILSGWRLRHSNRPARVAEEHSETAYMTMRAREFIKARGEAPWCLHLSYIKPHWPYIAPAPYHALYGPDAFLPVVREEREREHPHPVYRAFMSRAVSRAFERDEVRHTVLPAYMGLIKQIDDHMGRLLDDLRASARMDDTMIVFTSDHGDYLGDHWLGEKELFHEASVRIPLIIYDPRPAADATRGTACDRLVEAIDLLPTFIEATGAPGAAHWLEGRSLLPLLEGRPGPAWREAAFSEIDYAAYEEPCEMLGVAVPDARGCMVRTHRWKYIHYKGFPPQLFDLENDPTEIEDLGRAGSHEGVRAELKDRLFERLMDRRNRVAVPDAFLSGARDLAGDGIHIGRW